ncbi:hypothetical protein BJX96DRAFT_101266 [Aspergillus floccosus]
MRIAVARQGQYHTVARVTHELHSNNFKKGLPRHFWAKLKGITQAVRIRAAFPRLTRCAKQGRGYHQYPNHQKRMEHTGVLRYPEDSWLADDICTVLLRSTSWDELKSIIKELSIEPDTVRPRKAVLSIEHISILCNRHLSCSQ